MGTLEFLHAARSKPRLPPEIQGALFTAQALLSRVLRLKATQVTEAVSPGWTTSRPPPQSNAAIAYPRARSLLRARTEGRQR